MLADLSSQTEVRRLVQEFTALHPRLDVLINNVGGLYRERYHHEDHKSFPGHHGCSDHAPCGLSCVCPDQRSAATPDNRAIIQRYIEIVNSGDLDALAEIVAPDFRQTSTELFPNPLNGPALLLQEFAGLQAAFPGLRYSANQIIGKDALVHIVILSTSCYRVNHG